MTKHLPLTLIGMLALTPTAWADHYRPPTQQEIEQHLRNTLPSSAYQEALRSMPPPMTEAEADRLWDEHERLEDQEMENPTLPPCPSDKELIAAAERERQALGLPPGAPLPLPPLVPSAANPLGGAGTTCYSQEIRVARKQYRAWHRAWMRDRIDREHPTWEDYLNQKQLEQEAKEQGATKP
jgi:hypothetical protein